MKRPDDNERLRAGTLPEDPAADAGPPLEHAPADALRAELAARVEERAHALLEEPGDAERQRALERALAAARMGERAPDPFAEWRTLAEAGVDLSAHPPRRAWLLKVDGEGALPLGKCGVLAAGGGTGKTMALVQLALAVATGLRWLDRFDVEKPGNVLLALAEEDLEEVQRRFYRAACAMDLDSNQRKAAAARIVALPLAGTPVALTTKDDRGNITDAPALAALRERMNDREWSLVVLDPLSRWAGDDTEIDNAAATRFVQAVETLVRAPGSPAVLVAHHSSKASAATGAANVRGASGIVDGFRWAATMDKIEAGNVEGVRLRLAKSNYTKRWDDVFLAWASAETGHDEHSHGAIVLANEAQRAKLETASTTGDAEAYAANARARETRAEAYAADVDRKRLAEERRARDRATDAAGAPPLSGVPLEIPGVGRAPRKPRAIEGGT